MPLRDIGTHIVKAHIAVYVVILLSATLFVSACSRNQATREEEDLNAVKGIAFLVVEANYQHERNQDAIKAGVNYSRHWLAKQSADRRSNLQELSHALSSLIINKNVEVLEQLTGQVEHIDGKLDDDKRQQIERAIAGEEGFAVEWQNHQNELDERMIQGVAEFRAQLAAAEDQEQMRQAARSLYMKSQPLLKQAMESRISEIFAPN